LRTRQAARTIAGRVCAWKPPNVLPLSRASYLSGQSAGESIPTVFQTLKNGGVVFRRGQTTVLAAAPGVGKSLTALRIALEARVPTLYISADTDAWDTKVRTATHLTGHRYATVEKAYDTSNGHLYDEAFANLDWLRFKFAPSPSLTEIDVEVEAFGMVYGEYPHIIIVDNLRNVYPDDEAGASDYTGALRIVEYMHDLGRESNAHVFLLAHLVGKYEDGDAPVPLSGLENKIGKLPEKVLTMYHDSPTRIGVCVVKNRGGKGAADASIRVYLNFDPEYVRIG
ncbi:MAG: AAA family ATPase, partial [bacterium]